jgi:NADH-quinone oxidoreductase subunit N
MGYILLGFISGTWEGLNASLVYIALYAVMTTGLFAFMISVRRDNVAAQNISDFSGLSSLSPKTAYGMAALLFSLSGIPPMSGFFGKFLVFESALNADMIVLAVVGVLSSVVAAYYYLAIIKTMFFDKMPESKSIRVDNHLVLKLVSYPALTFTLLYCLSPSWLLDEAGKAAASLIQ